MRFLRLTEAEPLAHLLSTVARLFLRSLAEQLHQGGILACTGDLIGEIVIFCGCIRDRSEQKDFAVR